MQEIAYKKILWSEGTYLGQQHFQQWEQYLENINAFKSNINFPYRWGFTHLEWDKIAIKQGELIVRAQGVFKSGEPFGFCSKNDNLKLTLPPQSNALLKIYLCVAKEKQAVGVPGYPDIVSRANARWQAKADMVPDNYDNHRRREVMCLQLNEYLACEPLENKEQIEYLPLMVVSPIAHNQFEVVENFIPPLLCLQAHKGLLSMASELVHIVKIKIQSLQRRKLENTHNGQANSEESITINFLLLTLYQYVSTIEVELEFKTAHPVTLYKIYNNFYNALQGIMPMNEVSLPLYEHAEIYSVFTQYQNKIVAIIEQIIPIKENHISLEKISANLFHSSKIEYKIFKEAKFFIRVSYETSDLLWSTRFVKETKLAAIEDISTVIGSALTGVKIGIAKKLPNTLPLKAGNEYFYIEQQGEFWKNVIDSQNIAIYISNAFVTADIAVVTLFD